MEQTIHGWQLRSPSQWRECCHLLEQFKVEFEAIDAITVTLLIRNVELLIAADSTDRRQTVPSEASESIRIRPLIVSNSHIQLLNVFNF